MPLPANRFQALLPRPRELTPRAGAFRPGPTAAIAYAGRGARPAALRLACLIREEWGLRLSLCACPAARSPVLALGASPAFAKRLATSPAGPLAHEPEAYRLDVSAGGARVGAASAHGLLWGAMSLRQLVRRDARGLLLPCVRIDDRPRYPWRGFMVDSGRAPNSIPKLKRIIRICSAFKLNLLVFREGDDELNAVRYRSNRLGSADPRALPMRDLGALARYAARLGVALVPEIESLGHSAAKGRHYPELVEGGLRTAYEGIGVHVRKSHLLPSDPRTLALLDSLYREWLDAARPPLVHLGLDEVRLPAEVQAAHLAKVLPLLFGRARACGVAADAIVWSDAPPTPGAYKRRVIRCLWEYADGQPVSPDSPNLVRQGIVPLSEKNSRERVFMAGGSASRHTANSKSNRRDAYANLAAWSRWGADRPQVTGLLAVQWGGNDLDAWLPDFLAAAAYGWTPAGPGPDFTALDRRIRAHLARLKDAARPGPAEVDRPAWDGIWLKGGRWHREVQPIALRAPPA